MLHTATAVLNASAHAGVSASLPTTREPERIRWAAADLFAQGRSAEADLLVGEALQHYPDSQDLLAMRALLSEVRQDWPAAAQALERLLRLQGAGAPVQAWRQWVRVLRCQGEIRQAIEAALQGLAQHANDPDLARELAQLESVGPRSEQKAA